jgi:hypothetical protein
MRYSEFQLRAWTEPADRIQVLVHSSPEGSMRRPIATTVDPIRLEEVRRIANDQWLGAPGMRARIAELSRMLSGIILPDAVSALLSQSLDGLGPGEGLRVRFCLDEPLVDLPWEYLAAPASSGQALGHLIHDERLSLVREAPIVTPPPPPTREPQRMVVVGAFGPGEADPWNIREEYRALEAALQPVRTFVTTDFVEGSGERIREALRMRASIFHYSGHTDVKEGRCYLVRELLAPIQEVQQLDETTTVPLYADRLSGMLFQAGTTLAVFIACNSGRWGFVGPLLRSGIPAVIGVQGIVSVKAAFAFVAKLYSGLVVGLSLDEAVAGARFHVLDEGIGHGSESCEWGAFMVYMPTTEAVLFPRPAGEGAAHDRRVLFRRDMSLLISKRDLRRKIVRAYRVDELARLISDLKEDLIAAGIDPLGWLDPGSGTAEDRAYRLIESLDSRGLLAYLIAALRRDRPDMSWPSASPAALGTAS